MVMLRFTLQSFQLSITMNHFHTHTPLQSSQLMMMKWIIFWNYFIQNTMKIFWMLTSICFKLDWWLPLLKKFIQYLLCCFIKTEDIMLQSQILCHTFIYFSPPRPFWNWIMETRYMPKELGLFYVAFLTVRYISSGTSLLLSRSHVQHYIIRWPKVLYWF